MSRLLDEIIQLAAKAEGVEGTAEALTNAEAIRVKKPFNFEGITEMNERNIALPYMGKPASISGKREANADFGVELKGSGSAGDAPEWAPLIQACGFGETIVGGTSVTYAPISTSIPSISLAKYIDGVIKKMWGARGDLNIEAENGLAGHLGFTFKGADYSIADGALLAGMSYDSTIPPIITGVTFTIDSYAFKPNKIALQLQNTYELNDDIAKASGHLAAIITQRRIIGSMDAEAFKVVNYGIDAKLRSGAEGALNLVIGATAGNIITITAPKVRYTKLTEQERNGLAVLGVDFELSPNAGNDEISIALT